MQTLISGCRRIASTISSQTTFIRYASKKAKGSSNNGRDSVGKRLGPKVSDGEYVETGHILVRQRGTKMWPGMDVGCGRDHTLYALKNGLARFCRAKPQNGKKKGRVYVSVEEPPDWRWKSIQKKIKRLEIARYRGPILHAPRFNPHAYSCFGFEGMMCKLSAYSVCRMVFNSFSCKPSEISLQPESVPSSWEFLEYPPSTRSIRRVNNRRQWFITWRTSFAKRNLEEGT